MAKISARGATEVKRWAVRNSAGAPEVWVLTSDGRVLARTEGAGYGSYNIIARLGKVAAELRTERVESILAATGREER